jgi:hypothetical protein
MFGHPSHSERRDVGRRAGVASLGRDPSPTRRAVMPWFALEVHPRADEAEAAERWYLERDVQTSTWAV